MNITDKQQERLKNIVEKTKSNKFWHYTSVDEILKNYNSNKEKGRNITLENYIALLEKKLNLVVN